jgi:hypothetical protein
MQQSKSREAILEDALLEYVAKFGLTDKARDALLEPSEASKTSAGGGAARVPLIPDQRYRNSS